jgi:hypothetical protein
LTVNWNSVSGATAYLLDVSPNSSFSSFVSGYSGLNVGASTSHSVGGLSVGTTYWFRVRAVSASGTSDPSTAGTATTQSSGCGAVAVDCGTGGGMDYEYEVTAEQYMAIYNKTSWSISYAPSGRMTTVWCGNLNSEEVDITDIIEFKGGVTDQVVTTPVGCTKSIVYDSFTALSANPAAMAWYNECHQIHWQFGEDEFDDWRCISVPGLPPEQYGWSASCWWPSSWSWCDNTVVLNSGEQLKYFWYGHEIEARIDIKLRMSGGRYYVGISAQGSTVNQYYYSLHMSTYPSSQPAPPAYPPKGDAFLDFLGVSIPAAENLTYSEFVGQSSGYPCQPEGCTTLPGNGGCAIKSYSNNFTQNMVIR